MPVLLWKLILKIRILTIIQVIVRNYKAEFILIIITDARSSAGLAMEIHLESRIRTIIQVQN